ncbi:protein MON2 homolog isoform X2 [Varroa jacobsoni]|uniref:protein MON2 homolog isoform X2 n=1 Tax=Varroa jacobsoni TaxID=62625 RepID=UPI000BF2CC29|nr:protein MON2 homolog isoform X2 [Varroa jacobsoni]
MGSRSAMNATDKKLLDNLQSDLRQLSNEAKRKFPAVKEAAESGIVKLRNAATKHEQLVLALRSDSPEILEPFFAGCESKHPKIVQISLNAIQRMINIKAVNNLAASNIVNCLWNLMETGLEEVKILQTITQLLVTTDSVQDHVLAKALVISFRLHFTKNLTTNNTASATIRQCVNCVFERARDHLKERTDLTKAYQCVDELKTGTHAAPPSLARPSADAYLLFQDLTFMVNAEQPTWLLGLQEMTRSFGLELIEDILAEFYQIFITHPEFTFLLKERVCPLVIKLFSPNTKFRAPQPTPGVSQEKPFFAICMRLIRIVSVLIARFYSCLVTECEIFLSLITKFLDPEKVEWQRALALEVMYKMCSQPDLLRCFCIHYDMKAHSSKILQEIINSLCVCVESLFLQDQIPTQLNPAQPGQPIQTPQPVFNYKGRAMPLLHKVTQGPLKPLFAEMLDKVEPSVVPEGYCLSIGYVSIIEMITSITKLIHKYQKKSPTTEEEATANQELCIQLVHSSWGGLISVMGLLLETSCDEQITDTLLTCITSYAVLCGQLNMCTPRDAFISAMCKGSLPPHYTLTVLTTIYQSSYISPRTVFEADSVVDMRPSLGPYLGSGGSLDGGSDIAPRTDQIVAVGTPLPTRSLPQGAHQGPVMLTAKNLQCMRALLILSQSNGAILSTAWHMVLTTLQHLVWILGLKPAAGGGLKAPPSGTAAQGGGASAAQSGPNATNQGVAGQGEACLTTAITNDLPVLSAMLSRLFENSQKLSEVALHHLIDALCKLSQESMELAFSNREPSLFAVAKLLETALVNLGRVTVFWRPLSSHLNEVCQHPHTTMREWGAEALTYLVKSALNCKEYNPPLAENPALQQMLLAPLVDMGATTLHFDIRAKQIECTLAILHAGVAGESLSHGWQQILSIIGNITDNQGVICVGEKDADPHYPLLVAKNCTTGEALVRSAFQCLQRVVADFLPIMPCSSLQLCIQTAAKFGLQTQDLNVSLTAIGLLWNIADYLYQNKQRVSNELGQAGCVLLSVGSSKESTPTGGSPSRELTATLPPFDQLWMTLFSSLGDLCVDPRSAVRKSGGQTLFSTINAHGGLLEQQTWQAVLWNVLFPLLDRVRNLSGSASTEKVTDMAGNILIHHSRNTAQKQWAETQVLTLGGVARVFYVKRDILQSLGDFGRAWALLLEFIENSALSKNNEVSLSALKSFQDMLHMTSRGGSTAPPSNIAASVCGDSMSSAASFNGDSGLESLSTDRVSEEVMLWETAWRVWCTIGLNSTQAPAEGDQQEMFIPSQPFLTALIHIFPLLFQHIKSRFQEADLRKLCRVLENASAVPMHADTAPFILPSLTDVVLSPLQEAILSTIDTIQREILFSACAHLWDMLPVLFEQLLRFSAYACQAPSFGAFTPPCNTSGASGNSANSGPHGLEHHLNNNHNHTSNNLANNKPVTTDWITMSFVPFGERAMEMSVSLYTQIANKRAVIQARILHSIVKALHIPLALKYRCPSSSTWKLAVASLLSALHVGLPIAHSNPAMFEEMWADLAITLEEFLFSDSVPPPNQSLEEQQNDESLDTRVIQLIRECILPHAGKMPKIFVLRVVALLNKGSIHSATSSAPVVGAVPERNSAAGSGVAANLAGSTRAHSAYCTVQITGEALAVAPGSAQSPSLTVLASGQIAKPISTPINQLNNSSSWPPAAVVSLSSMSRPALADVESSRKLREEFAKACFETLLQFSFLEGNAVTLQPETNLSLTDGPMSSSAQAGAMPQQNAGVVSKLAITSLLHRFEEVISSYVEDERLSGKCPLPRHRMSEISFVLKAIATLIASLKKAPRTSVDPSVWKQLIALYPSLVKCTTSSSPQVCRSLRESLHEYADLLSPPS